MGVPSAAVKWDPAADCSLTAADCACDHDQPACPAGPKMDSRQQQHEHERQPYQQPAPEHAHGGSPASHAQLMEAAFERSEAAAACQWDMWAGVSLSVLLLLALPSCLQRPHWRSQLGAFVAEVFIRLLPAALAMLSRERYVARRTHIVAACRLVSSLLPRLGPPPVVAAAAWGGWRQFMLLSGALGVSTLPWLARLPFRWFATVHLVGVLSMARSALAHVCTSPAFTGPAAAQQYAAAAKAARALALLAPMPSPQDSGSCVDALARAGSAAAEAAAQHCACGCRQVATWLLVCLGFALPLAAQYLVEASTRRRFLRRSCRAQPCESCAVAKGVDLWTLGATVVLLLASFSGVAWQLVAFAYPAAPAAAL